MTEAEIVQIEAEVVQVWEGFVQAFRELDMDGATGIFHPDHTSINYEFQFLDHDAMMEMYQGFFGRLEAWEGGRLVAENAPSSPEGQPVEGG